MPPLTPKDYMIIAALTVGVILFMVFVSPRLIHGMATKMSHDPEADQLSVFDRISLYIASVTMFLIAVIVAIMFFEIVSRYLFLRPTLWVNELSLWLGGMVYLFGGLYAMQQRCHIRITVVYDAVPRAVQRLFDIISTLCIVAFAGAVVYGYWGQAMKRLMRWEGMGTEWNPPIPATMGPLVLIVTALIALQAVNNLFADWHKDKILHDPTDEI